MKTYGRSRLLLIGLLLSSLAACGSGPVEPPDVSCRISAGDDEAALCLKGVSVELGAADQVTAYHDLAGMVVLLLPDPAAARGISADDDPNAFGLTVDTVVQLEQTLRNAHSADETGALSLPVEPGPHVLCATTESELDSGERIAGCRRIILDAGIEYAVLVRYNPWGDFISFDWQTP